MWLLGLAMLAHAGGADERCRVPEPPRPAADPRTLGAPLRLYGEVRPTEASRLRCTRPDVRIDQHGRTFVARQMAARITPALSAGDAPLWLSADRDATAPPQTTGVMLVETFDARGRPAGAAFLGPPDVRVEARRQAVARLSLGDEQRVDLAPLLQGEAVVYRVSALAHDGQVSSSAAYLVPEAHRQHARSQAAAREAAARDHARSGASAPAGPEADQPSIRAFAQATYASSEPGWADLVVRVGDVDNFGLGFPDGFNPFSGRSTSVHASPFYPSPADPPGTDRIMVGTGYDGAPLRGNDQYLEQVRDRRVAAESIVFEFLAPPQPLTDVLLQVFLDDLQPRRWGGRVQVTLDDRRVPHIERILNDLDQTGPIGRLLSFSILPEYFGLLEDGRLELRIDDPVTGAGDAFAIDFAQLAFDPTDLPYAGELTGTITDEESGQPVSGALVSSGYAETVTDTDGSYVLPAVPAGLVVLQVTTEDHAVATIQIQVISGQQLVAPPVAMKVAQAGDLASALARDGQAELPGVEFLPGSASLTDAAILVLGEVLENLVRNPDLRLLVTGHTDATGSRDDNEVLSQQRAEAVVDWLQAQGVSAERLRARGFGSSLPLRSNTTPAGRAANRRVEIIVREKPW